jgi:hypothetical protein
MSDVSLYERAAKSFDIVNGIPLLPIGEDEIAFVALGHHDAKTVLRAFNDEARSLLGWIDLVDGDHEPTHDDECDEEDCPRHEPDSWLDDFVGKVQQSYAYFHEHTDLCEDIDREEGCSCDEYGWYITWNAKPGPQTFPVTVFETR